MRIAIKLPLLALVLLAACAAPVDPPEDAEVQASEDELRSEEESFAPLEATDDELARAAISAPPATSELTLFAIPAPRLVGLSWKSPGALARRTLINEGLGFSHAIGHAGVRVDCAATPSRPAARFQGAMTNIGDDFRPMVLKEKAGLGVLFRTIPGELESEESLQSSLDERYANGRVSFLRIKIDDAVCHGLLDYEKEYDARDIEKVYGFVRPLYQEGSGCSAFAMSFLRLAGLIEPYMADEWKFDVRVPMTLVGGETNPGNRVTVLRLLLLGRPWARPDEPHLRVNGWDPTLMFKSLRLRAKSALRDGSAPVEKRGRALGLVVDRRGAAPSTALASGAFFSGAPSTSDPVRFLTADP
jgi:hypothetical protein